MNEKLLNKPVLAMLQPSSLPGTYKNKGEKIDIIIEKAINEAKMIEENKFDGLIIQNMNDMPIKQFSNFQTVAYMTQITSEIKRRFPNLLIGVLINWDGVASLAVADAVGADFIRVEHLYTGVNVTSGGMLQGQCTDIIDLKMKIGSDVPIFADVYEVHGVPLGKKSYGEAAWEIVNEAFADGIFTSGKSVDESIEIAKEIKSKNLQVPVYLGGGATGDNIAELMKYYDGVSVATWIKDGDMANDINPEKAKKFINEVKKNI
ncbi:BtpA/SgcQ family protein [Anaerococcus sp. Marseille-Q7828]|uniref:BtpA/SgcQ family protein n=1 Tax=Anaerococcus sp. Marseille-Q7828 TaxID=3036300 RepID=UPI0024AE5232|nr:BtpA/SgcQ family protein [Anaerococcus sp. Marseille-Q7828]